MLGICVFLWSEIFSFEAKYFGSKWNEQKCSQPFLSSPPLISAEQPLLEPAKDTQLHISTFYIPLPPLSPPIPSKMTQTHFTISAEGPFLRDIEHKQTNTKKKQYLQTNTNKHQQKTNSNKQKRNRYKPT